MPHPAGSRIGAYEILAAVGAGAMGEVYRARDTRLEREVAIKVLPDAFAADSDRVARLEREARVLAALDHPNIARVYGLENDGGIRAVVMELVAGETLAERLARGAIALEPALAIARAVAEALEAAHARGIVHRDLKPANIKVRQDGTVKVLDFGLAKALEGTPGGGEPAAATLTRYDTRAGVVLGTAAYMAPEQARGESVDRRADIWSFGVVLFEMLAGRRPFAGENASDAIAEVLKSEPAWSALPALPAGIERLLRRCLEKNLRQRQQDIADARLDLDDAMRGEPLSPERAKRVTRPERVAWGAALVAVALGAGFASQRLARPGSMSARASFVDIDTPGTFAPTSFALSPDGRALVFSGSEQEGRQLFLRSLDTGATRPLPGAQDALHPFWSPDGRSVGFFTASRLMVLNLDGGTPVAIAHTLTPGGGTWNQDGTILYVPVDNAGMFQIPAAGGERKEIVLGTAGRLTRFPQFLPDGRHFLFYVPAGGDAEPGVYVGSLDGAESRRLTAADGPARYTAGHLLFVQERSLLAQAFDPASRTLSGTMKQVADRVVIDGVSVGLSVSAAGSIAYRPGEAQVRRRRLIWFDRSGKELGVASGEQAPPYVNNPALSLDGKRVAVQATERQNTDIYTLDLERNTFDRLTVDPGVDAMPVWSADGSRLVYNTPQRGLTVKRLDGSAADQPLMDDRGVVRIATDWSRDGRFVLYKEIDPATATFDLWAWSVADQDKVRVASTQYNERDAQFSPDGRFVAFESDELGHAEIYLQSFPRPGSRHKVSVGGGTQVRWRADGKEVFYVAPDKHLMAVAIREEANLAAAVGTPVPLFVAPVIVPFAPIHRQQYVVSADGRRFLINTADQLDTAPLTLLMNWSNAR